MKPSIIRSTKWSILNSVAVACLLGSVYPASAAQTKDHVITASPGVVLVEPGKSGSTTLSYNAGKKHPYVEVWVSVNGGNLKKVLEDDGDGKGVHKFNVGSKAGVKYRFVLTDFGKELASVTVTTKSAASAPPGGTPPPVVPPPPVVVPPPANTTPAPRPDQMLNEINAFRAQNGLPPLTFNNKLISVGLDYAKVMARMDTMGHSVDGTTVGQRLDKGGYKYSRFFENVAWNKGQADPAAQAVKSWRESTSGHREAMLSRDVTEAGIGIATSSTGKVYFCLVLGKPR